MIPILLALPRASDTEARQACAFFSTLGHKRVLTLAISVPWSVFTACLIWCLLTLISTEEHVCVMFCLHGCHSGLGEFEHGIVVRLVPPVFWEYFGYLWSSRVLGHWKVGDMQIFCLCLWSLFSRPSWFENLHFGFGRDRSFLLCFWHHLG